MAKKRRALRPYKYGNAGYAEALDVQPRRVATILHPKEVRPNPGVPKARAKHKDDHAVPGPTAPSLADRFHALPSELRAYVFSFLLTQPVKWQLHHDKSCFLCEHPNADIRPSNQWMLRESGDSCRSTSLRAWRILTTSDGGWYPPDHVIDNPWRSKYAPEVANPFMDSDTWDANWREKVSGFPFPGWNEDMPCLCARRQDLDVLLVCRRWYEEASTVLWSTNTFAFESCDNFIDFTGGRIVREKVTKLSILRSPQPLLPLESADDWAGWDYPKVRRALIISLSFLPKLTHLELSSTFLHDPREVRDLLRLGLRRLRSVRFIHHPQAKQSAAGQVQPARTSDAHPIYPALETAVLLRGGLAEAVARAMKGEHVGWFKHHVPASPTPTKSTQKYTNKKGATPGKARRTFKPGRSLLQVAVERHVRFEEKALKPLLAAAAALPHRIVNAGDIEFWEQLWWKTDGRGLGGSQSFLGLGGEWYAPRGWSARTQAEAVQPKQERAEEWQAVWPFAEWELDEEGE